LSDWGRVLTAMVTPFDASLRVDYEAVQRLARYLAENGSDGIVVAGSTGESATLSQQEKLRLFETVVETVGDRVRVIAGTGGNNTAETIDLTKKAEATGVHGIMLVAPYYNKPPQDALYEHFKSVAAATRLPVMIYNVPGRTGVNVTADTIARLAEIPNVVAVKEASGDLVQIAEIRRRTSADFRVYSGDDALTLPILAVGGHGVVSVASHVAGKEMAQMINLWFKGQVQKATELHLRLLPLFGALFVTTNPIPVKHALKLIGHDVGGLRPPLRPASSSEEAVLAKAMRESGVL